MTRMAQSSHALRLGWVCALMMGILIPVWAQEEIAPTETAPEMTTGTAAKDTAGSKMSPEVCPAGKPVYAEVDRPIVPLQVHGSLETVNAGSVDPWDYALMDLRGMEAAFGVGMLNRTVKKAYNSTGDMFTFVGRTFLRTTDPKTGPKLVEVDEPFYCALSIGIPGSGGEIFPRIYRVDDTKPCLLHSMLEDLANDVRAPIGVLGWVEMPEAKGIALKSAPIKDEAIFGSKMNAYLETITANTSSVIFFATVVPTELPRPSLNAYLVSRQAIGYDSPEAPAAALINVYGAVVEEKAPVEYLTSPIIVDKMRAATVKDIFRVQGHSTVQGGMLFVYRLDAIGR